MAKGTQGKLGKVRPPRVQITYDVEIGGASKEKELPFVVGVLADLSAKGGGGEQRLKDRNFVEIDADSVDKVMAAMRPAVTVRVPNKLTGEGYVNVEMKFEGMDSFSPQSVARSVPALAQMLDVRGRLSDLLAKLEGNDRLNDLLAEVVMNTAIQHQAQSEAADQGESESEPAGGRLA